jgi:multiple sugar transport system substrate-binding protein
VRRVAGGGSRLVAAAAIALTAVACRGASGRDGVTVVTFWHGMESGVNNRVLETKIGEFNRAHPSIRVEAQVYGAADQLGPKLDAAVAGRTPPDLLWWAPAFFPKYASAGVLRPIDDFVRDDETFDRGDVYDNLWAAGTYKGRLYVTPFSANNLAVYYNRRLFSEAGLTRVPGTWEEFAAAARALTRGGVAGFQIPIGSAEWTVWIWQCFLWQANGELVSPDGRAAFSSEAGVAALDFWRSLLASGAARFSETDAGYKTDDFLAGRVAMVINGPWNYAALRAQRHVEVGAFPLPRRDRAATNIGGESLFLFRSTPERERAAWEFMKFVMGPAFQVDWAIDTGYLPVSKAAASSERYRAYLAEHPFLRVYNDQMAAGRTRPSLPEYPALSATLGKYLEAAMYDKYSSREALARAAADVDRLLTPR